MKKVLLESYKEFYDSHQADLGRYFRLLYNVLRFLKDKKSNIPEEMYETYHKLVKASLSDFELFLIMANCLTDAGEPMKKYVSQFELFDNLPKNILLIQRRDEDDNEDILDFTDIWSKFDKKSFGQNPDYKKWCETAP